MTGSFDLQVASLSRFIVRTPKFTFSLVMILAMGGVVEIAGYLGQNVYGDNIQWFGLTAFTLPGVIAFLTTPLFVRLSGDTLSWDWSGLMAAAGVVLSILISLNPLLFFFPTSFQIFFAVSLGCTQALRLLLLATVADYRISRVLLPASIQGIPGLLVGFSYFGGKFLVLGTLLMVSFTCGIYVFVILVERPLRKNFGISPLGFANAFLAHITGGSKKLDEYFRMIGEQVIVPQVTLFFFRDGKQHCSVTVPSVHPGPMGEVGGSNLPWILHDQLGPGTMVPHGASTHDFNPVEDTEIRKISSAVKKEAPKSASHFLASKSQRVTSGSVHILGQTFGDMVLLVSSRAPLVTDDLDYSIGFAINRAGSRYFSHVAFIDAHNSLKTLVPAVLPATPLAMEYLEAADTCVISVKEERQYPLMAGYGHRRFPFTRAQGFGDLGVQVLAVRVADQTTCYVLLDGNNLMEGQRDQIRDSLMGLCDEAEVMTSDTHVVNTVSGLNQIGAVIPAGSFLPIIEACVHDALSDLAPAGVAASTVWCRDVVVFGSQRISQLTATVGAMTGVIVPLGAVLVLLAFLAAGMGYFFLT